MTLQPSEPIFRTLAGKIEERLITSFFVLYKTARIIEQNNTVFVNQTQNFYDALQEATESCIELSIKVISGRYFVNEKMVRFDDQGQIGASGIVAEWKTLGVGGVTFQCDIDLNELRAFVKFLSAVKPTSSNLEKLSNELKSRGWSKVRLLSVKEVGSDEPALSEEMRRRLRQAARNSFFQAMAVVQDTIVNATQDREISLAKTRRVVHSLIDHIMRDESSLIELAAIKDYDDYTYAHSTNVCIYALTLGVRLGMDRPRLSQLGFAALFHDIGKVKLPADLIRKPDAFDENDWIQMQRHPLLGAKTILRGLKLDVHTSRAARAAFEHHINSDFTGYPMLHYSRRQPNLFSRIISIVDTFDALCSGRVYFKKTIPPDAVLKKMRYQMSVKFDTFLLELFTNVVGIYPAGSLVLLTTDEIALILTNNDQEKARPFVKVVGDKSGLLESPLWVDLSLPEHAERTIVRLIDPARYGLDIKAFILRD